MTADFPQLETTAPADLHRFVDELHEAGFSPIDDARCRWNGPLPPALGPMTAAREMTVVIHEGWPYRPPSVEVPGLRGWHANYEQACLWQEGDTTLRWVTLDGILARIDEWVASRARGFGPEGAALDAWAYFDAPSRGTVSIEMAELTSTLPPSPERSGNFGLRSVSPYLSQAVANWPRDAARRGRWFAIEPPQDPPRNLDEVKALLSGPHRRQLTSQLRLVARGDPAWSVVGVVWSGPYGTDMLIVVLDRGGGGSVSVGQLLPTPHSIEARLRRAGSDVDALRSKRVALLGVGSIGSQVAVTVASSGGGFLRLIDADILLPANVVRHAAPAALVGHPKAWVTGGLLKDRCPWMDSEVVLESPWSVPRLRELIGDVDLVIDATGNNAFAIHLAKVCAAQEKALVSVALYRGGRVARVRRQLQHDYPIGSRHTHWRYPTIPAAVEGEDVGLEVGCTSPVTNAPPNAAAAAAVRAADIAIDVLTGRVEGPDELVEVLRALDEPPFDRVGPVAQRHVSPDVYLTSNAEAAIRTYSGAAYPNETGGILLGVMTDIDEPWIVQAVEVPSARPSPSGYRLPDGQTQRVVEEARRVDGRLGYLGEWHSHPNRSNRSTADERTMESLAQQPALVGDCPVLIVARRVADDYVLAASRVTLSGVEDVDLRAAGALPPADPEREPFAS